MPRHGTVTPGSRERPTDDPALLDEQTKREQNRRLNALTSGLPTPLRDRVRSLSKRRFSASETLEESWAALHAMREHYATAYFRDCDRAEKYMERCEQLEAEAAELEPGPERVEVLTRAAMMRNAARIDHAEAAKVVAVLLDAERKCQDSLAEHRPSGYTRVQVQLVLGLEESDPTDNVRRHASEYDAELGAE